MPGTNPDGTVQVAPPTMSAFAPQATQPPPPQQAPPGASTASPGVAGAIRDMIAALAQAFAPKGITQAGKKINQQVNQADPPPGLGNEF